MLAFFIYCTKDQLALTIAPAFFFCRKRYPLTIDAESSVLHKYRQVPCMGLLAHMPIAKNGRQARLQTRAFTLIY
jgi:hypothetical protein